MNKREKELIQLQLKAEEDVIKELEKQYKQSLKDINEKVRLFESDIQMLDEAINTSGMDETARAMLQSQRRSKVYQKQFQEALQGQIGGILDRMQGNNYSTIESYLKGCYEDAFIGTMYQIHGQGIPIVMPIDQAAAVKAIMTDSKISKGLYTSLGVDVKGLKKSIRQEITRGISSGLSYSDIARNIASKANAPLSRAKTIVRTEGHRIQQQSTDDARKGAISRGCDVVKQWDATLDGKTRRNHRLLDGQIREEDEPFEVAGKKVNYPGDFGDPAEDCNCRCVALTRARWALDEDELKTLQERAEYFGLDKTKDFEDYKKKFLQASKQPLEKISKSDNITSGAKGAYNRSNDPDGKKREAHAERYYESVRNSKKDSVVETISHHTSISAEYVSKMYDHLFINEYDLDKGHVRFDADYDIAESIQRLREGKNIQEHDVILVYHEAMEYDLMNNEGLGYEEAHEKANRAFNYQKALDSWYDKL